MNETKALRALQRGDTDALGWFIGTYTPYVSAIIRGIIGGSMTTSDVEETASDVFLALWNTADKVRPDCIRGYLGSIARNKAKNKLRKQGREAPLEEDVILLSDETPEGLLEKRELERLVRQAVLAMNEPDREIFLRFYYYYQPILKIAREMELNEATVKTRLRRGREKLKTALCENNVKEGGREDGAENIGTSGLHTG